MMQMVITITIIAIVSTVGVLGINTARAEFRLQSSARLFATYVEKARADSIRRHATGGAESSIETFGAGTSSYAVTMDYGSGTVETRTFQLESGTDFMTAAQKVTFDWRGRLVVPCDITKTCVFQIRSSYLNRSVPVDVSGSGDITVGEQHFPDQRIPAVEVSEVTGDVDPDPDPDPSPASTPAVDASPSPDEVDATPTPTPTPTPNGNGNGGDNGNGNGNDGPGNPNGDPSPTPPVPTDGNPSPTPTPTPVVPCVSSISPSSLSLSQSNATNLSGTATFSMSGATGVRTISASQAGHGNSLNIGLSLVRIDGSGSSVITISTKNGAGNRGVFIVEVSASPGCGSTQQLTVIVSN